jgi:hypothetical protein
VLPTLSVATVARRIVFIGTSICVTLLPDVNTILPQRLTVVAPGCCQKQIRGSFVIGRLSPPIVGCIANRDQCRHTTRDLTVGQIQLPLRSPICLLWVTEFSIEFGRKGSPADPDR